MEFHVGTSGYSYKEWKGHFYPEDLPANEMLHYYGSLLPSVEINNTFYRMPRTHVLETWAEQVPDGFRFSVKASQRITHHKRLSNADDEVEYLITTLKALGSKLGVVLFQLPPNFKIDTSRLDDFLDLIPTGTPAAFEFRHKSWLDDDVYDLLRKRDFAWCIADTEDDEETPVISTAPWGYLRLRKPRYSRAELKKWIKCIRSKGWDRVFVFFKHEDEGSGPKMAAEFLKIASD